MITAKTCGIFQSTRPVRGATFRWLCGSSVRPNFNPRAPCGARHAVKEEHKKHLKISIHAPRAGRDVGYDYCFPALHQFQSTRPVRGATIAATNKDAQFVISIHAPRAGRDYLQWKHTRKNTYFNPRAPCGARLRHRGQHPAQDLDFNPRAPCGARLPQTPSRSRSTRNFNPRAPCGARLQPQQLAGLILGQFQSTRPVRGATPPPPP